MLKAFAGRVWRLHGSCPLHSKRGPVNDSRWPGWQVIVGIEVHAQIKSRQKLFSDALTSEPNDTPNRNAVPFDAAFPGTLPLLNPKCVDLATRAALAFNADIQPKSTFDRKHYFYSDLPAGYQITQQYEPIARGGYLKLAKHDSIVRIKQIQLEQDTAKSTLASRHGISEIDLNRAGTGLMEIVSEPDLRSPSEAGDYIRTLQSILRSVGSSDGNMENGSLRCDINVSVNRTGEPFGTRCEVKNLNSIKSAMIAISSEVSRQTALLESGEKVMQETRGFDELKAETFKLRSKEDAPDYRYMPDPNIPPLIISPEYIEAIRKDMPETPSDTRERLLSKGLLSNDIEVLMAVDSSREIGLDGVLSNGAVAYFDGLAQTRDPQMVMNWLIHDLLGGLGSLKQDFGSNPVSLEQMGNLLDLISQGTITGTSGKEILQLILAERTLELPSSIAKRLGLLALSSSENEFVMTLCDDALRAYPEEVEMIRQGHTRILNKLIGRVMKDSQGRASAQTIRETLTQKIEIDETVS